MTKIEWINPHSFIYIDVKSPDGTVANWAVEFGAPNALIRRGARKTDFPFGGEVTVNGYRAKSGNLVIAAAQSNSPMGAIFSLVRKEPETPASTAGRAGD